MTAAALTGSFAVPVFGRLVRRAQAAGTGRDDDRSWKAGLAYINRGDPAVMISPASASAGP